MSKVAMRYAELIYRELESELIEIRRELRGITAESPDNAYAFASLPTGLSRFEIFYCTDGLKEGESTGFGTGVPCYFDPNSSQYKRLSDNAVVSI